MEENKPCVVDPPKGFSQEDLEKSLRIFAKFHEALGQPDDLTLVLRAVEWRIAELDLTAFEAFQRTISEQSGTQDAFWRGVRVKKLPKKERPVSQEKQKLAAISQEELDEYADI